MLRLTVKAFLLSSIILTSACSWKDVVGIFTPSKGIETEVVIGDKKESVETKVNTQEAEKITNTTNVPFSFMALAALGWFLPSPQELYKAWRNRNARK